MNLPTARGVSLATTIAVYSYGFFNQSNLAQAWPAVTFNLPTQAVAFWLFHLLGLRLPL